MESFFPETLVSSNTDLAAVLQFFGFELPKHNPAIVAEVYKWSELRRGIKRAEKRVIWNFIPNPENAKSFSIAAAFEDQAAHDKFDQFVAGLSLGDKEKEELKALHSASVARAGSEICAIRKSLLAVIASCPDEALWEAIAWDNGRIKSIFPKAASPETKAKFLEKVL